MNRRIQENGLVQGDFKRSYMSSGVCRNFVSYLQEQELDVKKDDEEEEEEEEQVLEECVSVWPVSSWETTIGQPISCFAFDAFGLTTLDFVATNAKDSRTTWAG